MKTTHNKGFVWNDIITLLAFACGIAILFYFYGYVNGITKTQQSAIVHGHDMITIILIAIAYLICGLITALIYSFKARPYNTDGLIIIFYFWVFYLIGMLMFKIVFLPEDLILWARQALRKKFRKP